MKKDITKLLEQIKNAKTYEERYKIDVSEIVEKKGRYDYISWSYCELIGNIIAEKNFAWNLMDIDKENGFVNVKIVIDDIERSHKYPILNNKNKPIDNPNSFDINNSQMRGHVKLFSMMTGIGLKLFTGEDLKQYDAPRIAPKKVEKMDAKQWANHYKESLKDLTKEERKQRYINYLNN